MKLFSNGVSVCMNEGCLVNRNVVNKTIFRNNISCTNRLLFLSAKTFESSILILVPHALYSEFKQSIFIDLIEQNASQIGSFNLRLVNSLDKTMEFNMSESTGSFDSQIKELTFKVC